MQINNNTNSPNFTAIRIVKATPAEYSTFVGVFPKFCKKNKVFRGESFNHFIFRDSLIDAAESQKQSEKWLTANAKIFGIDTGASSDFPMFVFTGFDKLKLKLITLKNIFTQFKMAQSTAKECREGKFPTHLLVPKILKRVADDTLPDFERLVVNGGAKQVTFDEFLEEVIAKKI